MLEQLGTRGGGAAVSGENDLCYEDAGVPSSGRVVSLPSPLFALERSRATLSGMSLCRRSPRTCAPCVLFQDCGQLFENPDGRSDRNRFRRRRVKNNYGLPAAITSVGSRPFPKRRQVPAGTARSRQSLAQHSAGQNTDCERHPTRRTRIPG